MWSSVFLNVNACGGKEVVVVGYGERGGDLSKAMAASSGCRKHSEGELFRLVSVTHAGQQAAGCRLRGSEGALSTR